MKYRSGILHLPKENNGRKSETDDTDGGGHETAAMQTKNRQSFVTGGHSFKASFVAEAGLEPTAFGL